MLFEQIETNKKKSIIIVIVFIFLVVLTGAALSYYLVGNLTIGLVSTAIFMSIYVPISISTAKKIVMRMNHARKITTSEQAPQLWNIVEGLSIAARIPLPEIYIIEEDSPNAFAAGLSPSTASVAVTTALLEQLNREELEGVIAHEIAHIKNYDVRLTTISLALVAIIAIISDFATSFIFRNSDNKNPILLIISLILLILSPVIAQAIHFSLSRNREFLADASGAELCRNPHALASALEKISSNNNKVDNIPRSAASMYISDPFKKKKTKKQSFISRILSTHPPTEERIKRLMNM